VARSDELVPSTTSPDVALRLLDVVVDYGGIRAVDGVSMAVHRGSRWAVIGPNGAGKTTLFKAISGEVRLSEGHVHLADRDITRLAPYRRARLGVGRTYQVSNLFPDLSVADTVALGLIRRQGLQRRSWWPLSRSRRVAAEAHEALERVRLGDRGDVRVSELSHGEQRQLELALAVATSPSVLLLDEPAAGLTASERIILTGLIRELPQDMTLLMIEHDIELALGLADRVLCLDNGRPIAEGTPSEIRENSEVQSVYLKVD
jgi:branched-chain amino acid transport system ATP-binding protein